MGGVAVNHGLAFGAVLLGGEIEQHGSGTTQLGDWRRGGVDGSTGGFKCDILKAEWVVIGAALGAFSRSQHAEETGDCHVGAGLGKCCGGLVASVLQQCDRNGLDLLRGRVSLGVAAAQVGKVQMHGGARSKAGV